MLKEGEIIEGPFWPEPIEVKKVENYGDYIHIVGWMKDTFFRVANALVQILPQGKEKQLLEGFLRMRERMEKEGKMTRLDDFEGE